VRSIGRLSRFVLSTRQASFQPTGADLRFRARPRANLRFITNEDIARSVLDGGSYVVLATAGQHGTPWASPVWYATRAAVAGEVTDPDELSGSARLRPVPGERP
jgi:hypothetical protein